MSETEISRRRFAAPNELDGIPLDHPTLASLLGDAGHETALIGKWHCGYLPWFSPTRLGWESFFGNFSGGLDYFSKINHTWPFSGAKGSLREGGIRVPTLLSWPGTLPSRRVVTTPVHTTDWTATFLELGRARAPADRPLDGSSLVGHLLRGRPAPSRDLFWRMQGERALRRGALKYRRSSDGRDHLYDLSRDTLEQADLARRRPEELAALRSAWEQVDATLLPYAS